MTTLSEQFDNDAVQIYNYLRKVRNDENIEEAQAHAEDLLFFLNRPNGFKLKGVRNRSAVEKSAAAMLKSRRDNAKWLKDKIVNMQQRFSWVPESLEDACQMIIDDAVGPTASHFSKKPEKQNLSEEVHAMILTDNDENFVQLPNRGPDQLTPHNGQLVRGPVSEEVRDYGANADFEIRRGNVIITTNKITNGAGGLQEAQMGSVRHFLKEVLKYLEKTRTDKTTHFAAIVDGSTFTMYNDKKMNLLKKLIDRHADRIFVGTMKEFIEGHFAR